MSRTTLARQARRAADPAVQRRARDRVISEDGLTTRPVTGYEINFSDLLAAMALVALCFALAGYFSNP